MNFIIHALLIFTGSFIFIIVNSLLKIFFEKNLKSRLKKSNLISDDNANIILDGLGSALAIFAFSYVNMYIESKYNLERRPFFSFLGILMGAAAIMLLNTLYSFAKK